MSIRLLMLLCAPTFSIFGLGDHIRQNGVKVLLRSHFMMRQPKKQFDQEFYIVHDNPKFTKSQRIKNGLTQHSKPMLAYSLDKNLTENVWPFSKADEGPIWRQRDKSVTNSTLYHSCRMSGKGCQVTQYRMCIHLSPDGWQTADSLSSTEG